MNQDFNILNEFKGFGDPKGKYWFVGIEEAANFGGEEKLGKIIEDYSSGYKYIKEGEIRKDSLKCGRHYTKVYDIMSKIIVELEGKSVFWKDYRDEKLLQKSSNEFQMNLFPLGKKTIKDWPECYQIRFGFKCKKDYIDYIEKTRFKLLREFHQKKQPELTICFGITSKEDFKRAFNLKEPIIYNEIEFYENEGFLMTPFFDNRNMGWKKIHKTVELAKRIINLKSKS